MTTVLAVAAALAISLALGSLIPQADGATLRRWRLSRRWDVSRLARELIAAADEPLATLRGLMHMINAWERGARQPSERYWLLYLRVFPECASREMASGASSVDQGDFRALAATVKSLEHQIAGLSRRLEELSPDAHGDRQPHERSAQRNRRSGHWRGQWTPLWIALG